MRPKSASDGGDGRAFKKQNPTARPGFVEESFRYFFRAAGALSQSALLTKAVSGRLSLVSALKA